MEKRPRCVNDRHLYNQLQKWPFLRFSTFCHHFESAPKGQGWKGSGSHNCTLLAYTALVSCIYIYANRGTSNVRSVMWPTVISLQILDAPTCQTTFPSCRECLRHVHKKKKILPEDAVDILISSLKQSTLRQYDSALKNWWNHCIQIGEHPLKANEKNVIKFLTFRLENRASYGTLNSERSVIN